VNEDALKLTVYFGERDRTSSGFVADALTDVYERQELETSVLLRGAAGYGAKQHLRTDRQLTLSEDLPLVSVAVDTRARIERALEEIKPLRFDGLVTTESARLLTAPVDPVELAEQTKLTVYLGRPERHGGRPAYQALVERLHDAGIAGATVLLGVDGTAHGVRQRARFFSRNADVPLMVVSVGDGGRIAALLPELEKVLARPLATLERDARRVEPAWIQPRRPAQELDRPVGAGNDGVRRLRVARAGPLASDLPAGREAWQARDGAQLRRAPGRERLVEPCRPAVTRSRRAARLPDRERPVRRLQLRLAQGIERTRLCKRRHPQADEQRRYQDPGRASHRLTPSIATARPLRSKS
jgi:PII-like signaling protein